MDEELGVKVTRLRRRLSVEGEGAQSPATPSTPTKKRGGRLAKPALELIDENVIENVPKRSTRKSVARDMVEPTEEKALTPSRRSARIRSNTSLIAETIPSVVESPRAKRAARRNSQLGSDTETSVTPARQTRRNRKDSTSSIEKLAVANPSEKVTAQAADIIAEEPEKESAKDNVPVSNDNNVTPSPRKSPRLNRKGETSVDEQSENSYENQESNDKSFNDTEKMPENPSQPLDITATDNEKKRKSNDSEKENLSVPSSNINNIETRPRRSSVLNKTTSAIEEAKKSESNRKRTKSWNTLTKTASTEHTNFSDKIINNLGAGDSILLNNKKDYKNSPHKVSLTFNTSIDNKKNTYIESEDVLDACDTVKILEKNPSKDMHSMILLEDSDSNSGSIGKLSIDLQNNHKVDKNNGDDQCVPVVKQPTPKRSPRKSESFVCEPMDIDETIPENVTINVFSDKNDSSKELEEKIINDSKRNSSISNNDIDKMNESFNKSKRSSSISLQQESNVSRRKSSIGSTDENRASNIPFNKSERLSISDKSQRKSSTSSLINENENKSKLNSTLNKVESGTKTRKSSINFHAESNDVNNSATKSLPEVELQNLEKSTNENKSTLVLSQLKDVSTNETSNVLKSLNDTNTVFSKSVISEVTNDIETDKKNLSLKYLTSTPLQQKPMQKMALQINSSVLSPNTESTNSPKVSKTTSKKSVSDDLDTSSDESAEGSREKSKMIEDEAEEASDYESGDSRNDEERQYEEDNEIFEKGETLESEQEFSNDSDYEKDSFLVSSDEEDEELLSGSGDDLTLSDNELKMTAKSKKKYDERKRKEQKKASREMYEARHNLNESDKRNKAKSKGQQHLDSSSLQSEKDEQAVSKKKNRRRIDSSQDISLNNSNADESICLKKKKVKRLSESVCEDGTENIEKEITICNVSSTNKQDPLSEAVKQEPKTPEKSLNISTVLINDNIEEVQVDTNALLMKPNETSDPLQASEAQDEDSDSDISEQMEIRQDYDSILDDLNRSNFKQKQMKTHDTSLNLNKKAKNKPKEALVDQLNLTQVKKSKKSKIQAIEDIEAAQVPQKSTKGDDGDTSDSIDMRLLFPEDSNDSDVNASKFKDENKDVEPADEYIPLKRTEAKTNIRESMDSGMAEPASELNVSKKKSKNRKSTDAISKEHACDTEQMEVNFFIDTKGTHEDINLNTSLQTSAKKNKKKSKHNMSMDNAQHDILTEDGSERRKCKLSESVDNENLPNPADTTNSEHISNVSIMSDKKKKKNKTNDISVNENLNTLVELQNLSQSEKKVKKTSESIEGVDTTITTLFPLDISFKSDKKKKKNKSLNASQIDLDSAENMIVEEINSSMNNDKKKKKTKTNDLSMTNEQILETNESGSIKKNKRMSASAFFNLTVTESLVSENTISNVSLNSEKKKKKKNKSLDVSQIVVDNTGDESNEAPVEVSFRKEKNMTSESQGPVTDDNAATTDSGKKKKNKRKKKKNNSDPQLQAIDQNVQENTQEENVSLKKRKRDVVASLSTDVAEEAVIAEEDKSSKQKNKKRKITEDDDAPTEERIQYTGNVLPNDDFLQKKSNKLKKSKKRSTQEPETEITQNKNKKRKATDEQDGQKKSKVFKENSFDKVHVTRLPESIVSQLDDKPPKELKKQKNVKAISTMPFEVEEARPRKNKPSTYLEQSIYMNDSPVKKKQKSIIMNPKVLPFTPTAITSGEGYTSNFRINVLPQDIKFVAQASDTTNFKNEYLSKQREKKLGTFERFKKQRNQKLSKF